MADPLEPHDADAKAHDAHDAHGSDAHHAHDPLDAGHLIGHVKDADYFEFPRFMGGKVQIPQIYHGEPIATIGIGFKPIDDRIEPFEGKITKLMLTLATEVPVTGIPAAILATIDNVDADGDGLLDVDQILSTNKDLVLGVEDVGAIGDFHVIAALYVEGGGEFQPVPGVDYMAGTTKLVLGTGQVDVTLDLALVPSEQP